MKKHEFMIMENVLMFPFIDMGFEHEFDNRFRPSYSGETFCGESRCLVIFCRGCSKVFRQPLSYEVIISDWILLG